MAVIHNLTREGGRQPAWGMATAARAVVPDLSVPGAGAPGVRKNGVRYNVHGTLDARYCPNMLPFIDKLLKSLEEDAVDFRVSIPPEECKARLRKSVKMVRHILPWTWALDRTSVLGFEQGDAVVIWRCPEKGSNSFVPALYITFGKEAGTTRIRARFGLVPGIKAFVKFFAYFSMVPVPIFIPLIVYRLVMHRFEIGLLLGLGVPIWMYVFTFFLVSLASTLAAPMKDYLVTFIRQTYAELQVP